MKDGEFGKQPPTVSGCLRQKLKWGDLKWVATGWEVWLSGILSLC